MTRLADLVATSQRVADTSGRLAKVAALAELLRRLAPEEIEIAVAYLSGETRQGKLGLGYAALRDARGGGEPHGDPLTLAEVDAALERLSATGGKGSAAARAEQLGELFARAHARRARFPRAADRRRAPPGRAGRRDARCDRARRCPARSGRAPRGDVRRRPRGSREGGADRRRCRPRAVLDPAAAAGAADARDARRRRRGGARRPRHGRARVEARRRAGAGPQGRRRSAGLHPQPERRHRRGAGGRRGGASAPGARADPGRRDDRARGERRAAAVPGDDAALRPQARGRPAAERTAARGVLLRRPAARRR